jgi:hypothetical protein
MLTINSLQAETHYLKTNVCEVLQRGMANRVLDLEIAADAFSDGRHWSLLMDPKCPTKGLVLDSALPEADESVAEFESALRSQGSPGTTGRRVSGTFFGRLHLDRKTKRLSIALLRVENLQNVHVDDEPH